MGHSLRLLMGVAAGMLAVGVAGAQTGEFRIAPYLWAAGFDGTVGTLGGGAGLGDRVDVDFGRLSENIRLGGAMLELGWHSGRWSAFGDWTYAKVTSEAPSQWGTLYSGVDAEIRGNVLQAFAGYDLLGGTDAHLELFGGARYYDLEIGLDLLGEVLEGRSLSGESRWTDGVLGLRWSGRLAGHWTAYVSGDVGGGGSNLSWQLFAIARYRLSWGTVFAGWRHLDIDYDNGSFLLDAALTGPLFGVSFRL